MSLLSWLFKDKPEQPEKPKNEYQVKIIRTPNGVYKYKTVVLLNGRDIGADYFGNKVADTQLGAIWNARNIIKRYEKEQTPDELVQEKVIRTPKK